MTLQKAHSGPASLVINPLDLTTHNLDVNVKQVIAIVRPYLAERIIDNLRLAPLEALIVQEVKGYGRQKSYLDDYGDSEYSLAFLPKVEITMWVDDLRLEEVLKRVTDVARCGRMGDGKVMVFSMDGFNVSE
ncbi:MAG: P-II family nitrogen regulator [Planctomycetota bacterium]